MSSSPEPPDAVFTEQNFAHREMNSGAGEADGSGFDCLPDELVLQIFNKLWDAKWLFRCSLVCKRFWSIIISDVKRVFFSVPITEPPPTSPYIQAEHIESLADAIPLSPFRGLRHLDLELPPYYFGLQSYSDLAVGDGSFKWGAQFRNDAVCFAFLVLTSRVPIKENPSETKTISDDTGNELSIAGMNLKDRILMAQNFLKEAMLRYILLAAVVKTHPMLQSVTLTDTKKWGPRLCLSDDRLIEMKELANSKPLNTIWHDLRQGKQFRLRICCLPKLILPVSGYKVEELTLTMVQMVDPDDGEGDATAAAAAFVSCFEGEERFLGETLAEAFKNHKGKIEVFRAAPPL